MNSVRDTAETVIWSLTISLAAGLLLVVLLGAEELPPPALYRYGEPREARIVEPTWTAEYDGRTRLPRWTLEIVTAKTLAGSDARVDCFRSDDRCPPEFRASLSDYTGSGYDRGHLVPAGDFGRREDQSKTFTLANIAPQNPALNRGLWRELESYVRSFVAPGRPVWVVTVPLFAPRDGRVSYTVIGPNQVAVPTHFGKAILRADGDRCTLAAWIMPNETPEDGARLNDSRVSVDELERVAGLDLWAGLPDELETKLEGVK